VPADAPQTARDRWCDAEGTWIALFSSYLEFGGLAAS
jgi:hypothetical protein